MYKNFFKATTGIILSVFMAHCNVGQKDVVTQGESSMLSTAPTNVTTIHEMAFEFDEQIGTAFNTLTAQERIMVYYLSRAAAACTPIYIDHSHRHGLRIIDLFNTLNQRASDLTAHQNLGFDASNFNREVSEFLHYLLANHGQYFQREHGDEKRSPERIGLKTLTKQNIVQAFDALDLPEDAAFVKEHSTIIFDATVEPSLCVAGSIEKSAVNFYANDFTEADYQALPVEARSKINTYFDIAIIDGKRTPMVTPFAVGQRYSEELIEACGWLTKAHTLALQHTQNFDTHFAKSLDLMIQYLTTGDEELFKQHSIEWLKTTSRLDYCFGFIECYHDPKSVRSSFQAEVTVKTLDISKLNKLLPDIEAELPFPSSFKRDGVENGTASVPNASINVKLFGSGGLGPVQCTAAYCLPNYEEIRATHGSKQIIYPSGKGLGQRLSPDKSRKLFSLHEQAEWLAKNDPDGKLSRDIWDVQCILHETIGHASGKLATHTFKAGDNLTICGVTHKVGETIPVTNKNLSEFLSGYESALEEMRAEIVALYVSTEHLDTLLEAGFLTQWLEVMTKDQLYDRLTLGMAKAGISRLMQLSDNATSITGAHAQANSTITNYLIGHGGLKMVEEPISLDGKDFTVLGLAIKDRAKTRDLVKELMLEVQRIKSTGDGQAVAHLIDTYGTKIPNINYPRFLRECREHLVGKIKASVTIYPVFEPLVDHFGQVIDCKATWPHNFIEGYSKAHPQIIQP